MQITPTLLNIPPFISTTWDNVLTIKTENQTLVITLKNNESIAIPKLDQTTLQQVFDMHAASLTLRPQHFGPVNISGLTELTAMHHNPEEADLPLLPDDLLEKIAEFTKTLTKTLGGEDSNLLIPADPTCNCNFCQIARAVAAQNTNETEEEIRDEDLAFRDWQIEQIDTNLYRVTSPLDINEQYKVFLGNPIGCTCGQNHCEHIKAVLQS